MPTTTILFAIAGALVIGAVAGAWLTELGHQRNLDRLEARLRHPATAKHSIHTVIRNEKQGAQR